MPTVSRLDGASCDQSRPYADPDPLPFNNKRSRPIRHRRLVAPMMYSFVALMVAVLGAACASGGDASLSLPDAVIVSPSLAPSPTASPLIVDIPAHAHETVGVTEAEAAPTLVVLEMLPLDALSTDVISYLEGRWGRIGIAIVIPVEGVAYVYHGDAEFPLASVAKVPIMLTALSQVDRAGRSLNDYELELLTQMITVSDNIDAYTLWDAVGGADEVADYLSTIGIDGIVPNGRYWGESRARAIDLAETLAMLVNGAILSESSTVVARNLLEGVDEAQDWGVPFGAVTDSATTVVGVKNGWYLAPDGWRVNSAGYVLSDDDELEYSIAVLSNEQPSLEYGIETIEGLSRLLHPLLAD